MVFQSPSGIEQNRKVQLVLAVILVALVCAFFLVTSLRKPDVKSVDGIYRNSCCNDITISRDRILYGTTSFDFKLSDMKFGLTGFVKGRFTKSGVTPADDETAISFSGYDEKRVMSLPIDGHNYTFQLAPSSVHR